MPFILFLCALFLGSSAGAEECALNVCDARRPVSLLALLADPDHFDGLNVSTYGYIVMREEVFALCPQPAMSFLFDCLRVRLGDGWERGGEFSSGDAVYAEGRFLKPEHEHYVYGGVVEVVRIGVVDDFGGGY